MSKRQALRAELVLERGAEHAGLDAGGPGRAIDLEDPVEARQIDGHRARVALVARHLHTSDDARAAPVGDRRGPRRFAPFENRGDFAFAARKRDGVGRVLIVAPVGAHHVAERLPVGVRRAIVGALRADRGEAGRRLEPRRAQRQLFDPGRLHRLERPLPEPCRQRLRHRGALSRARMLIDRAPAPELASRGHSHPVV